jgi:hypothetical protein
MIEGGHLLELRGRARRQGHDRREDAQPATPVREPQPADAEIEANERKDRHDQDDDGYLHHAYRKPIVGRRLRAHGEQFEHAEQRDGYSDDEEQQIGVLRSLLEPDREMNEPERQARGSHHRPGDVDPVHLSVPRAGSIG